MIKQLSTIILTLSLCAAAVKGARAGSAYEDIERLMDSGQLEKAQERVGKLSPEPLKSFWQSKLYFYRADYGKAREEMARARSLQGARPEWEAIEGFFRALDGLSRLQQEFSSEHFLFRASGVDTVLAGYALDCLEKAYAEIGADLGYHPEGKVLVEVYPDKDSFALASTLGTEILEKSGTVGICKFNRLMLLSPRALPLGYSWLDTLCHEYTHLAVSRLSAGLCPLWLHEGVAHYHESRWRLKEPAFLGPSGENALLKARETNTFISFKRMHPSLVFLKDQEEIALAFAQVSSCVRFLKESFGQESVGKLLAAMSVSGEKEAFKKVTRLGPEKIEQQWKAFVAGMRLEGSPGALSGQANYTKRSDDEFVGADLRGLVRLGDDMRRIGRYEAALVHYEKALSREPSNPVVLLKAARALIALGELARAEEKLSSAVEKNPGYVTPFQALGELYYGQQKFDRAHAVLESAVAVNPFSPRTHYLLARCCLEQEQLAQGIREMEICLILDPGDIETKIMLERLKQR
ncbi:MAG: tetratricopeptide repeat protein [Endomicrobiales bacterium]